MSTAGDDAELERARALTRLLDGAIGIPGTRFRIGLDPLLGLVPGLGDVAGAAMAGYLVTLAARLGAPPVVILRMLGNVGVDAVIGAIPFVGDLFDFGWKANTRNLALIERYVAAPGAIRRSSLALVGAAVGGVVLLAAGTTYLAFTLVRLIVTALGQ